MLTEVYLRADTRIDEQPVPIEATIGKDFFLQLARPATLGTPVSFGYWLNETYKTKVNLLILDDLDGDSIASTRELRALEKTNPGELVSRLERHLAKQGIPEKVQNLLSKALLAKITIIDLLIDGRKSDGAEVTDSSGLKLRFGLEVSFETSSGLDILPNIILDKVTLIVSRFPQGYKFPPRAPIPTIEPVGEPVALPEPKRAGGSISFSDNPAKDGTITLNGASWTFVDQAPAGNQTEIGKDLGATIDALVANLKPRQTPRSASARMPPTSPRSSSSSPSRRPERPAKTSRLPPMPNRRERLPEQRSASPPDIAGPRQARG